MTEGSAGYPAGRSARAPKVLVAPADPRHNGQPHERLQAAYEWQMGVWGWLSQPPRGSEAAMRANAMVVPDRTEYIEIPVFADLTTLEDE